MRYFYFESAPTVKDKYIIKVKKEELPFISKNKGSYNVFIARILNLSYADYLRYCRDRLGADLMGKNKRYVIPYFDRNETTEMFLKLLNDRMKYILNEYNHPYEVIQEDGVYKKVYFNEEENKSKVE